MDHERFDQLARNLGEGNTRRKFLTRIGALVMGTAAAVSGLSGFETDARKNKGHGKKGRKKGRSEGGSDCHVGDTCTSNDQCCTAHGSGLVCFENGKCNNCRTSGHPCEGKQVCCPNLDCGPTSHDSADRCCSKAEDASCSGDTDCCSPLVCDSGKCRSRQCENPQTCEAGTKSTQQQCCEGYVCCGKECVKGDQCPCEPKEHCESHDDCCGGHCCNGKCQKDNCPDDICPGECDTNEDCVAQPKGRTGSDVVCVCVEKQTRTGGGKKGTCEVCTTHKTKEEACRDNCGKTVEDGCGGHYTCPDCHSDTCPGKPCHDDEDCDRISSGCECFFEGGPHTETGEHQGVCRTKDHCIPDCHNKPCGADDGCDGICHDNCVCVNPNCCSHDFPCCPGSVCCDGKICVPGTVCPCTDPAVCQADSECCGDQHCCNGKCQAEECGCTAPETCNGDGDCCPGSSCCGGQCRPVETCPVTCSPNAGRPQAPCSADCPCNHGQCIDGFCRKNPKEHCKENADCASGRCMKAGKKRKKNGRKKHLPGRHRRCAA